jgi:aminoglycoside phosphotransferase (APT) family kinase protein
VIFTLEERESPVDIKTILPQVQKALTNHLYEQGKARLKALEVLQINPRAFSTIIFLLARTSMGDRKLVMKTTVHHPINKTITESQNQAVVEYNIIKYLDDKFHEVEKCSIPKPVLVVPEAETYLMDFVEGSLLMDQFRYARLLASRKHYQELQGYLFYCGQWLKHFQEVTGIKKADAKALDNVIARAEQRLKLIEERGDKRVPKYFQKKVMDFFHEQMKEISNEEVLISGRHGDYTPFNILAGPQGITVIDFLGYQEDPILIDILKMLVFLEDEARAFTSSKNRVKELKEKFLDGYGTLPQVQRPVLLICEAMQRVVSLWGHMANLKKRFHHRFEANLSIKAHLAWLTQGIPPQNALAP